MFGRKRTLLDLPPWTKLFLYRTECTRTTWTFRVGVLALVLLGTWLTSGWWTVAVARSLVCEGNAAPSDAILLENFDPDYLVFERAGQLRRAGLAARVLVPVSASPGTSEVRVVELATTEVLQRFSRIGPIDIVPMREVEPISLNAARDILRFLQREHIRSVIVVSPLFRSRRSSLVYGATLARAGVAVRCDPVRGSAGLDAWIGS